MCNLIFTFVRTYMSAHTYMSAYMQEYVYSAQAPWLCWLCCVMVGMCFAAASWQSKNGLLVTLPPLNLWQVCTTYKCCPLWRSCAVMVGMRLAAASWRSSDKDVLRGGSAVLEWAVSFQTPFHTHSRPGPAMYHPWPTHRVNKWQIYIQFSHRLLLSYPLRMGSGSLGSS